MRFQSSEPDGSLTPIKTIRELDHSPEGTPKEIVKGQVQQEIKKEETKGDELAPGEVKPVSDRTKAVKAVCGHGKTIRSLAKA